MHLQWVSISCEARSGPNPNLLIQQSLATVYRAGRMVENHRSRWIAAKPYPKTPSYSKNPENQKAADERRSFGNTAASAQMWEA
jgi:hypothetical protein